MPIYKGTNEVTSGNLYKATTEIENGYKGTNSFYENKLPVDYVLVGGGGYASAGSPLAAGSWIGGGGGGGYLTSWSNETGGGPSGVNVSALELQVGVTYTIDVGHVRVNLSSEIYGQGDVSFTGGSISITANEGGEGGNYGVNGGNGGCGGGAGRPQANVARSGGTGNQGYDGADTLSLETTGAAGGGADSAGVPLGSGSGGQGGDAKITTITGSNIYVGAGGGRSVSFNPTGYGGPGSGVSENGTILDGPYLGATILRCPTTTYNRMTITGIAALVSTSGSDTILQFGHATKASGGGAGLSYIQIV